MPDPAAAEDRGVPEGTADERLETLRLFTANNHDYRPKEETHD